MALFIYLSLAFTLLYFAVIFFKSRKQKNGNENRDCKSNYNTEELQRYQRLRQMHLSEPLTERMRPKNFTEIIGQKEGIAALKAALATENPQHVIIYGPPGVGKTAAARLALDYAKGCPKSPFSANAPFVEIDGATARFDERGIADPLLGSVHDPIYQGAGALGSQGVPQPKPGAVNNAHGGVLFIDEIGELHPIQINKLLKVLEDRRVMPESAYYNPFDKNIPEFIHDLFKNGLPADFRLIAATTKSAAVLPEALRSRCVEIYFRALQPQEIAEIAINSARELELGMTDAALEAVCRYAQSGRDAVNILQLAKGFCDNIIIEAETIERIAQIAHYRVRTVFHPQKESKMGFCVALAEGAGGCCEALNIEAEAFPVQHGQLIISASQTDNNSMEILKGIVLKAVTSLKKVTALNTEEYDIHINFDALGMTLDASLILPTAIAIYSACTGQMVREKLLISGELSISGELLPLEKLFSKQEFLRDYEEIKLLTFCEVVYSAQIISVNSLNEALYYALCAKKSKRIVDFASKKGKIKELPLDAQR